MKTRRSLRRVFWPRLVTAVLAALLVMAAVPGLTAAAPVYPNSMAALGDSITRAFNTGWFPFIDAPQNSWATGTTTSVNSHYLRIRAVTSLIQGKNYNYAKSGAKMSDLNRQAGLVPTSVQYVTILMGANDVCTSSEATMTPVQTFRDQFQLAMTTLAARVPNARIYVISIPDVYHLWDLFRNNSTARSRWSSYKICQSMLVNPTSTAQSDVDRRGRVRQRNIDFNTQLAAVCALYSQCRFDSNKAFNYAFAASDVSTRDYFHPSLSGQATVARELWSTLVFEP